MIILSIVSFPLCFLQFGNMFFNREEFVEDGINITRSNLPIAEEVRSSIADKKEELRKMAEERRRLLETIKINNTLVSSAMGSSDAAKPVISNETVVSSNTAVSDAAAQSISNKSVMTSPGFEGGA